MKTLVHDGDAVTIALEQDTDVAARDALLDRAMAPNWKKKTSAKIRKGRLPAEGLAFVARDRLGAVVGTVRLWNVTAGTRPAANPRPEVRAQRTSKDEDSFEPIPALLLGPLAVDPDAKSRGTGSLLMRHALAEAARLGHGAVLLVGDAPYYARFGFSAEKTGALALPGPVERDRFLAGELEDGFLAGAAGMVVAAGRKANVDGLGLEAAGVVHSAKGIEVDARLRSSNKRIFAAGDVALVEGLGAYQFTHVAGYHAGIIIRNALFKLPAKVNYDALPWVTYTDPEIAHVGLTEAQARQKHGDKIRVLRWSFAENDRAQAERATEGLVKVVVGARGRVLGASIVGPQAGELLHPWVLAISQGLKIGALANMIAPYPTLGEVNKRAAGSYYTPSLFSERTKKIVRFLQWLG